MTTQQLSDYADLAQRLTAAGMPSTVSAARRLAERDFYGGSVDIIEAVVLAQWQARPWKPSRRNEPDKESLPKTGINTP